MTIKLMKYWLLQNILKRKVITREITIQMI